MPKIPPRLIRKYRTALLVSVFVALGLTLTVALVTSSVPIASVMQRPTPQPAPFHNTAVQNYRQARQEIAKNSAAPR